MKQKVIWSPLPGSQALAMNAPCNHILFEGTRGPGKTDAQLMRFRRYVGMGYGQAWRGIIFDRQYKSLDDLIAKSKRWFPQFHDGARFLSSQSALKWVWPTGEELLFRHMHDETDYDQYHGHEYPFIGWNELTKYPTSACYDVMMSTNRSSFVPEEHTPRNSKTGQYETPDGKPLDPIPMIVFSTTNPFGAGHNWVKRRFIDPVPAGEVKRMTTEIFNPRTQKRENITKTQVRLFGSYKENRYLSPEYVAELENITDQNRKRAWLEGDWDITAGGAFDDVWNSDLHIVPRFQVPGSWRICRSMDWGSSHPFSVGWWAISNGEEVAISEDRTVCFPKDSLIRIAELYGADVVNGEQFGHNKGRKLSARRLAQEVLEVEEELTMLGWIKTKPEPGPADNQIYNVSEDESGSIASMMEDEGVEWTRSDKKAGSRANGFQIMRDMMERSTDREGAGLYIMNNCDAFINTIPSLPRDDKKLDDVDTDAEDHVYDEARYMVLDARPQWAKYVNIRMPV